MSTRDSNTLAPRCAGKIGDDRCPRRLDDNPGAEQWLVLLGTHGQPCYYFCPDCEQAHAEWIDRNLGPEGQAAGCTGMVRLESGSPAEVYGMIRDIPDDE